ncbi:hypothetical protein [Kordia jejudonensis]|uniref:hypothetical protein n=1 Tax=Kordia jejudonensis TaxID=1348245 RepID=UPI0006296503|nr:hypothetical protein [Kordia jejudonensis]
MELEYIYIKEFLKLNQHLEKGDYIYKHDKDAYPLKDEFDLANLYFVTESQLHNLTLMNMYNKANLNIDLDKTKDHFWILQIPSFVRKQIWLK